jgi:hypothetical protein
VLSYLPVEDNFFITIGAASERELLNLRSASFKTPHESENHEAFFCPVTGTNISISGLFYFIVFFVNNNYISVNQRVTNILNFWNGVCFKNRNCLIIKDINTN